MRNVFKSLQISPCGRKLCWIPWVTRSWGVKLRLLLRGKDLGACLSRGLCMSSHGGLSENLGPFFGWMSPLNKKTLKKSWSSFATVKQHKLNHCKDLFYCHLSVFVSVSIPSFWQQYMSSQDLSFPAKSLSTHARSPGNDFTKIYSSPKLFNPEALRFRSV